MVLKRMREAENSMQVKVVVNYYGKEAIEPQKIIQTLTRCLYNEFGGRAHVVYRNEIQYYKDDVAYKEIDLRSSPNGAHAVDPVSDV